MNVIQKNKYLNITINTVYLQYLHTQDVQSNSHSKTQMHKYKIPALKVVSISIYINDIKSNGVYKIK